MVPNCKERDLKNYHDLLVEVMPRPIRSDEDADMVQEQIDALLDKGEARTVDEEDLLELLGGMILLWEDGKYELPVGKPYERIKALIEDNGLRQKDLVGPVFPTESIASEVLAGKRRLTYEFVDRLARYFHVPADLFYDS